MSAELEAAAPIVLEAYAYQSVEPTREDVLAAFRERHPGASDELATLADKINGGPGRRHAERVTATVEAAKHWSRLITIQAYNEDDDSFADVADAGAILILFADLVGVGGRLGIGGDGTLRHPAFRCLGRGRKMALDGNAWMAAANEAFGVLLGERQKKGDMPVLWFSLRSGAPTASVGGCDDIGPMFFLPAIWLRATMKILALDAAGVSLFKFRRDLAGSDRLWSFAKRVVVEGERVEAIDRYRDLVSRADVDDSGYIVTTEGDL